MACIADASPVQEYADCLEASGIRNVEVETHDEALAEMVRNIQGKLLGAELMSKLRKVPLESIDSAERNWLEAEHELHAPRSRIV